MTKGLRNGPAARGARPANLALPALVAVGLSSLACASAGPTLEIKAPIPSEWSSPRFDNLETEPVTTTWWRAFGDTELDRLIELVLASNRDLRSASARLDAALAQARIAGAARKPQAGFSTDGSRRKQNFIGLPIPGAEGRVLSNTSTTLGAAINVSWEADLWGRIRDAGLSAQARAEAAAYELEAARLSITGQTAKAWFAFLEARSQVALAKETLENRASVRNRLEKRYRQGLRTALDLRLAVANEANAEARYAATRRQQDAVQRQLEILLARDTEAMKILSEADSDLPALPAAAEPGLPGEVLRRRPDLQASERRLASAGLDIAAARKLLYPRLTLTGSTGRTSQELDDLLDSNFSVWSLAAGLLQPLFQGGRLRAGVALSEAAQREVLAQHESAVIRAVSDVEAQLANDTYLGEQLEAVARARKASSAAETLAQDRYFSGLADYLSVLAAQSQATTAASQFLEISRLRLAQRVDLYLALGGGLPVTGTTTYSPNEVDRALSETEESK
ncbi:MAG: efflux transporter outer membrane subunit [bacterium]|nr:efflux transporter outer membrane subunit [bacterium]